MRLPLALLLQAVLTSVALAGIDLTPRFIDVFTEGVSLRRLYFSDGDKKYVVSLNRETEVFPDSGGALFRFTKLPEATFQIMRSRQSPDDPFEGSTLDRYRESARRLLPVGVRGAEIVEETRDVYPINGWRSYRVTLSYAVGPVIHMQSVTFLNMSNTDQVALITSSPERDFTEASHRSFQIFRTWQEMLPGDDKPVTTN